MAKAYPYPKRHPRCKLVSKATSDMAAVLHDTRNKYGLTGTEYLQFLNTEIWFTLARMLRDERHGDQETPADIEKL